jgi:hypothetical protein
MRNPLRRLIEHIAVDIEGLADSSGWIDEYIDTDEDSINTLFLPGDQFIIRGHKIKLAGDDPGVGVFFVPTDPSEPAVRASRIARNTASEIIGVAVDSGYAYNKIEIRTQFSGSGSTGLKTPRVITSSFVLEQA